MPGHLIAGADHTISAAEEYGPDGYPRNKWNAVPREVNVKNSTSYHCETKMLREWFRASCDPYDGWTLKDVKTITQEGQQAYVGMFGPKASVVVQVIEGKSYKARYTWGPDNSTRDLTVSWPRGGRPSIYFNGSTRPDVLTAPLQGPCQVGGGLRSRRRRSVVSLAVILGYGGCRGRAR